MTPHVSLVLVVKDGMPYLPEAVASVASQTYRDFELVVQDGASTDGSLEYLQQLDGIPDIRLVSGPDTGIGQAYNRAVARCRGEIIGSVDSDNLLEADAVERAVAVFDEHPGAAAVYGGSYMTDADGNILHPWVPSSFDLLRLLSCELVPPFGVSFFSRTVCGDELRFEESMRTCADFDLWLRIAHLPIVRVDELLGRTRLSDKSMTRRTSTYDRYIGDKRAALDRYLSQFERNPITHAVHRCAIAGLYLWAAESVFDIEGRETRQLEDYLRQAAEHDPGSPRLAHIREEKSRKPDGDADGDSTSQLNQDEPTSGGTRTLLGTLVGHRRWIGLPTRRGAGAEARDDVTEKPFDVSAAAPGEGPSITRHRHDRR